MISILVGAVVMFIVGALWFTVLFGKTWSRLMNFTPEQSQKAMEGGMVSKMIVMFLLNLITASILYYLWPLLAMDTFLHFLWVVLVVWFAFSLPLFMNTYLWEGKSVKLVLINAFGSAAGFLALSAVIYFWK